MGVVSRFAASIVLMIAVAMNGNSFGEDPDEAAPEVSLVVDEIPDLPILVEEGAVAKAINAVVLNAVIVPILSWLGFEVEEMEVDEPDVADEGANFEAMVLEFSHQLRPLMTVELEFVRLVCGDLNPEQRTKIREKVKASVQQAATQMAKQQRRDERGLSNATTNVDPAKMIRQAITDALKENLTEEQMVRFTDEAAQRMSHRRKASILSFISQLDGQLFLDLKQREQIESDLSSHWQYGWESWLMMSSNFGIQYFPTVPEKCVIPHLNAGQKKIWEGLPKIDFSSWDGDVDENLNNDGWWGEEPDDDELALERVAPMVRMQKVGVEFDAEGVQIDVEIKVEADVDDEADDELHPLKLVPLPLDD